MSSGSKMKYYSGRLGIVVLTLMLLASVCLSARLTITAAQLLRHKKTFEGKIVAVEGIVRFDRLSQRGFLYSDLRDLRRREYKKTIFLELGNEEYSSLKIPDRTWVVVTGFLSPEEHGPLGVYPAHIIVDEVRVEQRSSRR